MKSNVCYNLVKTEYITNYQQYKFHFSSEFNKQRFDTQIKNYVENESLKLNAKYRTIIKADIVFALYLYRTIEKRGFYVLDHRNLPLSKNYEAIMVLV